MSLKEIARLSGTSLATVSRVLNNPDYHCRNRDLEETIWKTAQRLNYTPNHAAQQLKQGKPAAPASYKIDLFLARDFTLDNDPFFKELYEIIREELLRRHCSIGNLYTLPDIMEQSIQPDVYRIQNNHADGLILLGKSTQRLISIFNKLYPAMVGVDRNPTDFEYDEIACNGTSAATMALDYLISLGHRRIGYIGDCSYEARYIGYYQTLISHKILLDHSIIYQSEQTREGGYRTMKYLLGQGKTPAQLPTAFFCANDCTALGVLDALREQRGKRYRPSIISIDNIREAETSSPMLTTIAIPTREMAHHAVSVLLDRLDGYHRENVRVELPCHLVVRESCFER